MKQLIKPVAGLQVRKPDGRVLNNDGETLEYSAYWVRRWRDGDVTVSGVKPVKSGKEKTDGTR